MSASAELNSTVTSLFQDEETQYVFDAIIRSKKIRYRNLQKKLDMDEQRLDATLASLEKADLIGAIGTGTKEFQTFYPLASGLHASKMMDQLKYSK